MMRKIFTVVFVLMMLVSTTVGSALADGNVPEPGTVITTTTTDADTTP